MDLTELLALWNSPVALGPPCRAAWGKGGFQATESRGFKRSKGAPTAPSRSIWQPVACATCASGVCPFTDRFACCLVSVADCSLGGTPGCRCPPWADTSGAGSPAHLGRPVELAFGSESRSSAVFRYCLRQRP